ncbi:MAG: hypothetical protein ACI9O6_003142 [Glaciecola sp.]|jgi:hypothetical protein
MQPMTSRYTQIGDWIFEVKMVRALRVRNYGEAYTGSANMTINGDSAYIDTQMTREGDNFSRVDFLAFYKFCQMLELKQTCYDKMKNGERVSKTIDIVDNSASHSHLKVAYSK